MVPGWVISKYPTPQGSVVHAFKSNPHQPLQKMFEIIFTEGKQPEFLTFGVSSRRPLPHQILSPSQIPTDQELSNILTSCDALPPPCVGFQLTDVSPQDADHLIYRYKVKKGKTRILWESSFHAKTCDFFRAEQTRGGAQRCPQCELAQNRLIKTRSRTETRAQMTSEEEEGMFLTPAQHSDMMTLFGLI